MRTNVLLHVIVLGGLVLGSGCRSHNTRRIFTGPDNPTTQAGRGEPDLADMLRPPTWIYIDGQAGVFATKDGRPQPQWVIPDPVSPRPTFSVGVYTPVLGVPRDFRAMLDCLEGEGPSYRITCESGQFQVGRRYSLTAPGRAFTIMRLDTGEVVEEMSPLAPGEYLLTAAIGAPDATARVAVLTVFTVAGQ